MKEEVRTATVVLLLTPEGKVILARKKEPIHHESGSIEWSLSSYNGYGGKSEDEDEGDIYQTALRELADESSVTAEREHLRRIATIRFHVQKDDVPKPFMQVTFFLCSTFSGEAKESDEMGPPEHFDLEALPYEDMMPADRLLFPRIFAEELFDANVFLKGKALPVEIIDLPFGTYSTV